MSENQRRYRISWEKDGVEDSVVLTGTIEEIQVAAVREMDKRGIDINDAWSAEEETDPVVSFGGDDADG